jgi:hypothetical protein
MLQPAEGNCIHLGHKLEAAVVPGHRKLWKKSSEKVFSKHFFFTFNLNHF